MKPHEICETNLPDLANTISSLSHPSSLEELEINLIVHHSRLGHVGLQGATGWQDLMDTVTDRQHFPKLRCLRVIIHTMAMHLDDVLICVEAAFSTYVHEGILQIESA